MGSAMRALDRRRRSDSRSGGSDEHAAARRRTRARVRCGDRECAGSALALFAACGDQTGNGEAAGDSRGPPRARSTACCSRTIPGRRGRSSTTPARRTSFATPWRCSQSTSAGAAQARQSRSSRRTWRRPTGTSRGVTGSMPRTAFYVRGSSQHGSMGPTLASFGSEADAQAFAERIRRQGAALRQITLDMVSLDGGVMRDEHGLSRRQER